MDWPLDVGEILVSIADFGGVLMALTIKRLASDLQKAIPIYSNYIRFIFQCVFEDLPKNDMTSQSKFFQAGRSII